MTKDKTIFNLVVMHGYQTQVNDLLAENEALGQLRETVWEENGPFCDLKKREKRRVSSEIGTRMSKNGIKNLPELAEGIRRCAFTVSEADVKMNKKVHFDCIDQDIYVPITCSQVTLHLPEVAA